MDWIAVFETVNQRVPRWVRRHVISPAIIFTMLAFPAQSVSAVLWIGQQYSEQVWANVTSRLLSDIPDSELPTPASLQAR
ncbi:hypothetical protein [uncultured Dietzia sp.]|uniref:hypothetical protein n=1 Tax=uncultured Dietzia sp. TaxID=395519 RepID=UPI0025FBDFC7|nr:hypothetical protein [uncultured Dietzia sp.]